MRRSVDEVSGTAVKAFKDTTTGLDADDEVPVDPNPPMPLDVSGRCPLELLEGLRLSQL